MINNPLETSHKIIILDFDVPVTNRLTALFTGSPFALNPVVIGILNHICQASGAKLVCSSNRASLNHKDETVALLTKAGFDCATHLHKDWSCNYENTSLQPPNKEASANIRTHNIERWLAAHPETTHYAAIDDLKLSLKNLVHITDQNNGMSFESIQRLCHLLNIDLHDVVKVANPTSKSRIKFPAYDPAEHIKP
jgi:DNA-binding Xre family transcriptional regulator